MRSAKWKQKHRVLDTYDIKNNYTNAIKVYEDYIEFRTGRKHKKHRKKQN